MCRRGARMCSQTLCANCSLTPPRARATASRVATAPGRVTPGSGSAVRPSGYTNRRGRPRDIPTGPGRAGRAAAGKGRSMTHPDVSSHVGELEEALERFRPWAATLAGWGEHLAQVLKHGGRLLACGNGGSAAEAQHLTAELVG